MFPIHLAWRYAFSTSNRHRNASIVIVLGIAVSMFALITMLSLMNNLQSDLLDELKSIESFHIQLSFPPNLAKIPSVEEVVTNISSQTGVTHVYPYIQTQALLQNEESDTSISARFRVIDRSFITDENPFTEHARLVSGLPLQDTGMYVGLPLARRMSLRLQDTVVATVLGEGRTVVLAPSVLEMRLSGLFATGLNEFDSSTVLVDFERFLPVFGLKRVVYGIYVSSPFIDRSSSIVRSLQDLYPEATILSWQQANASFYSALLLEKILMYVFLFFMFIILGVNVKNASARLLRVKQRELAILRAIGSSKRLSSHVFFLQSAIITLMGEAVGIVLGLLVTRNISAVFSTINSIQCIFTGRNSILLSYPFMTEIRAMELLIVALVVLILSQLFTFWGCHRLLKKEPLEILYHE